MKKNLSLIVLVIAVLQACSGELGVKVRTSCGIVEGIEQNNGVKAFLGIPFAQGLQADVPLLAGWNSLEGVPGVPTVEGYKEQLRSTFGEMTEEIFEAYGILEDADVMSDKGFTLAGDLFTGYPTWKLCDYHARTSSQVDSYKRQA